MADELVATIVDGRATRTNVKAVIARLEENGARGIPIPQKLAAAIPAVCAELLQSDSARIRAAGAKLVLAAIKHNLELNEFADRTARLDAGQATQNHAIQLYGREAPIDAV
jgi:hypothetical protein